MFDKTEIAKVTFPAHLRYGGRLRPNWERSVESNSDKDYMNVHIRHLLGLWLQMAKHRFVRNSQV